jgi:hypothetical protein
MGTKRNWVKGFFLRIEDQRRYLLAGRKVQGRETLQVSIGRDWRRLRAYQGGVPLIKSIFQGFKLGCTLIRRERADMIDIGFASMKFRTLTGRKLCGRNILKSA